MKRAVTVLTTLMVFLIATSSAAAKASWRDAGIQKKGEGFRSIHIFENVSDDGRIVQRIFVPEEVELGGTLVTKILYLKTTNGQDSAIVWRLDVVGIASKSVELSLLSGEVKQDIWDRIKDDPLDPLHWVGFIERGSEERDVHLSYSIDAGTIRLLVRGFQEVLIAVHPQDSSYLTTEAWLLQ